MKLSKNIFHKENDWSGLFFFPKEHVSTLLSKEIKIIATNSTNDGIFLWFFATLSFDSFSTKVCLRFHWDAFFVRKRAFWLSMSTKKTPRRTKILISSVWNKILKIWETFFELIQIEVQCSKNYFKFFFPHKARASGNDIEKEPQKPRRQLKEHVY